MKKDFIMDGNRIVDCKSNIAKMSVWELIRFRLPRDVDVAGILNALLELVEPVWFLVVRIASLTLLPLFIVLLPLIAAREIRLSRQFVAKMEAKKTEIGSIEVYRMEFKRLEGRRFKCWAYNVITDNLGLHRILGVPSFDYSERDRQTGDVVFFRLKKDSKNNTEASDEVEKPEEA